MVHLSAETQQLLQAAAVLVTPGTADVLSAVSEVPGRAIDECLVSGTLLAEGGTYRFRHELTRRAVEDAVPAFRRRELHGRALVVLEKEEADVSLLAHHASGAGLDAQALRYGTAAGDDAAAVASHQEAVDQYARALEHAGSAAAATRAELHEKLAMVHSLRDHWQESLVHRQAALALRRELGDPERISENLRAEAICLWRLCRGDESNAAMEAAYVMMVDAPDSVEKGRTLINYSGFCSEPEVGRRLVDEALVIAERCGDVALAATALGSLGCKAYEVGGDGSADLEKALAAFLEIGESQRVAWVYTNLMEYGVDSLQLDETAWVYEEAMPYVVDHDIATYTFCIRATHAQALVRKSQHTEAIALVRAMEQETMSPINRCHMLLPLGISRLRLGDRGGLDDLREAWALAAASDDPDWMVHAATAVAQAAWILDTPSLLDEAMQATLTRPDFHYAFGRR